MALNKLGRVSFSVAGCGDRALTVEEFLRRWGGFATGTNPAGEKLGASSGSTRVSRVLFGVSPNKVFRRDAGNGTRDAMPAELVAALYRQRWRVELFFRWMKCILGCRHWLAESSRGVAIEIYLALIAALLLQLYSGRRPNRRMLELIQLHLLGVATSQDLQAGLERQLLSLQKAKAKKT